MFCSDWMSCSYFIMQTSKFLLINATAMTLGEGHGKVIQYILPDLYILCPKYLRFSSQMVWTSQAQVVVVTDATEDAVEMNWKNKVIPDQGDLIRGGPDQRYSWVHINA